MTIVVLRHIESRVQKAGVSDLSPKLFRRSSDCGSDRLHYQPLTLGKATIPRERDALTSYTQRHVPTSL